MKPKAPPEYPSYVRAYLNSEREADRDRALELCKVYGLDYATERARILAEMIEESRELGFDIGRKDA